MARARPRLLKLLTGELMPDAGNVKLGMALEMAKLDQNRASLHPEDTLANVLTGGGGDTVFVGGKPRNVISYMQDFLFTRPAGAHAGQGAVGRRAGAAAAGASCSRSPSNFLVLDEPTNDLDLETLDLLEETVGDYPGTVLVVSHDRDFLDRVATHDRDGGRRRPFRGLCRRLFRHGGAARAKAWQSRPPKAEPERSQIAPPARDSAAKLNFSESHALKTLPERIEAQNRDIAGAAGGTFRSRALWPRSQEIRRAFGAAWPRRTAARDADEELWLALEMKREALAQQYAIVKAAGTAADARVLSDRVRNGVSHETLLSIAGFAAGAAMMIGGALGAVSNIGSVDRPRPGRDADGEVMNPMIGGQAMLPSRNLLENISASPDHTDPGGGDEGFRRLRRAESAMANSPSSRPPMRRWRSCRPRPSTADKAQLARLMGYLVVPGKYDSQTLLQGDRRRRRPGQIAHRRRRRAAGADERAHQCRPDG